MCDLNLNDTRSFSIDGVDERLDRRKISGRPIGRKIGYLQLRRIGERCGSRRQQRQRDHAVT
jgi:hypothetical protein